MQVRQRMRGRKRSGAAIVEMAVILPIFIALVMGQIESSRFGMVSQLLSTAARVGCRTAVVPNTTTNDVQSRINETLQGTKINVGTLSAKWSDPGTAGAWILPANWNDPNLAYGTPVTVILRVRCKDVSWLPAPKFVGENAMITVRAVFSAERY